MKRFFIYFSYTVASLCLMPSCIGCSGGSSSDDYYSSESSYSSSDSESADPIQILIDEYKACGRELDKATRMASYARTEQELEEANNLIEYYNTRMELLKEEVINRGGPLFF